MYYPYVRLDFLHWPCIRGLAASAGVRLKATEMENGNVDDGYST